MATSVFESLQLDPEMRDELRERAESDSGFPRAAEFQLDNDKIRSVLSNTEAARRELTSRPLTEAIVRLFGRPALLVRNDTFEVPAARTWKSRLTAAKSRLERAIRSVGRIELENHTQFEWVGTGWMIAEDIIVTNRHVALEFVEGSGKSVRIRRNPAGRLMEASIDFKEEHRRDASQEVEVEKVIFVEKDSSKFPDVAFFKLGQADFLPPPIPLQTKAPARGSYVAVIGYPARDPRNDNDAMVRVFGDIYDVKRLAPGLLTTFPSNDIAFTHDCSTLGGNSGSVVLDIESGRAVGLHFGGSFKTNNYAVKISSLLSSIRKASIAVPSETKPAGVTSLAEAKKPRKTKEKAPTAGQLANRTGYDEKFLGDEFKVALPKLSKKMQNAAAAVSGANGSNGRVLDYTHFSIAMNRPRKMAFFTAANIDGNRLRRYARGTDKWWLDPRVAKTAQAGNELYADNDLDRGHLVRRLDPVWGEPAEARQANDDTFFFTNCSPQHKDFNQRTWNELEDYVLDNAGAHDLKVSVFTGPIFDDDGDPLYRNVRLPRRFWKVVAIVREDTGALSATGYVLSQTDLLTNLEFVYGRFKTYQVPISKIEEWTGLSFGKLETHDPLEKIETNTIRVVDGPEDMVF